MIRYETGKIPEIGVICALYESSGLPRPTKDPERIEAIYRNSNLILTAWDSALLVGIARSITDFRYTCYLADLAVRQDYQHRSIGKSLLARTREHITEECTLLLLATPEAMEYYPKLGMEKAENAFYFKRTR